MDSSLSMFIGLLLYPLVLGVSVQRIPSSEASHVLQESATNSCTIIVYSSAETGKQAQELPNSAESMGLKEIKEMQRQLEKLRAFIFKLANVTLIPHGVMVGKKIFKADRNVGDFEVALSTCSLWGSIPASPRNPAENNAVQKIVAWAGRKAIIGINDMATEGKFEYLNGEEIQYSNWAPGEPNNVGNEDCIEVHPDGLWHDTSCGGNHEPKLIVCELEL